MGLIANLSKGRKTAEEEAYDFSPPNVHGHAKYVDEAELEAAGYFKSGGLRFGRSQSGRKLFYNGKGHALLVAGARSGKFLTFLVTAIMSLGSRYSRVLLDPKLEMTCVVGKFLKRYGDVYVINPFKRHLDRMGGLIQASINPMDLLDGLKETFYPVCDKIGSMFWSASLNISEPHWQQSGGMAISGIVAYLKKYGKPHQQNLAYMRDVLTGATGETFFDFCRRVLRTCPDTYIKQRLGRFAMKDAESNRELASIISTADTATGWLGNEIMAEAMSKSTLRFRDLKRRPITITIGIPLEMLDVCEPFTRIMLSVLLFDLLQEGSGGVPIWGFFDEVAQVGPMKILNNFLGMGAGAAGLQMLLVYQSMSQIYEQFGQMAGNVIQNCGLSMWFGMADPETQDFVSRKSGLTEIYSRSSNVGIEKGGGFFIPDKFHRSDSISQAQRPLIYGYEAGELKRDEMICFGEGLNGPLLAKRLPYTEEVSGYDDNPYFQKKGWFD